MADVIIIGGGLAAAAAALRLGRAGRHALVLEAQARLGGRAYSRPFAPDKDGAILEYGGSWITPYQTRIRFHVAELGLGLRPRAEITQRLAWRGGAVSVPRFDSVDERQAHERVIARIAADAMLLKMGHVADEKDRALTGITFKDYLVRLAAPEATRHLLAAWWTVSGSGAYDVVAASEFISSCSYGGGLAENMIDVWSHTVEPGIGVLAARMFEASRAEVRLSCPVARIAQGDAGVTVTTKTGEALTCHHAIVAIGTNPMAAIEFIPPLSGLQAKAVARGHGGRVFKLWIKARGVAPGTLITGNGQGIEMLLAERQAADGTVLLIGFGLQLGGSRPGDETWVRGELARLAPNAEFISYDWHDWLADPYAKGSWVSAPADIAQAFTAEVFQPQGRVAFASSDYAPDQAGWFEGAVISGEAAAEWVLGQ